jgi:hypothetical protein
LGLLEPPGGSRRFKKVQGGAWELNRQEVQEGPRRKIQKGPRRFRKDEEGPRSQVMEDPVDRRVVCEF